MGNAINCCKGRNTNSGDDYRLADDKMVKNEYKNRFYNQITNQRDMFDLNESDWNDNNISYQSEKFMKNYNKLVNNSDARCNYKTEKDNSEVETNNSTDYIYEGYYTAPIQITSLNISILNTNVNSNEKENNNESKNPHSDFTTFGGDDGEVLIEKIEDNSFKNKQANNKLHSLFIYINLEYISLILSNAYEEYATFYKPYIEIGITNTNLARIVTPSTLDENKNKDQDTDKDNTLTPSKSDLPTNISYDKIKLNKSSCSIRKNLAHEKIIDLRSVTTICLNNDRMKYQNLSLSLKNGFVKSPSLVSSQNDSDGYQDYQDYPIPLIIGEGFIPIILLHQKYLNSEKFFDGYLEIKSRNVETVGYLRLKILISDSEVREIQKDPKYDNFFNNKSLDSNQDSVLADKNIIKNLDGLSIDQLNYTDYDPLSIKKYFSDCNSSNKNYIEEINKCERILLMMNFNNLKEGDLENFLKIYQKSMKLKISTLLYQVLKILSEVSEKNEIDLFCKIESFLKMIEESITNKDKDEEMHFTQIHNVFGENIYIIKNYITFIYNYEKHNKSNKSVPTSDKLNKHLQDTSVLKIILEIIKKFSSANSELQSDTNFFPEFKQEAKTITIMCLNSLSLLVSQNKSQRNFAKKEEKILENTMIYNNSITIISSRNTLLKLINRFITDSQIIGLIFKILRQAILNLTNQNLSLSDLKNFKIHPREFANFLKKILIEKGNGIFFTTLKLVLIKYHHNPQLHCNILAIIATLTDVEKQTKDEKIDSDYILKNASQLLNLNLLKDIFEIYRWRMHNTTYKLINQFHLNILFNFSNYAVELEDGVNEKENILEDFGDCGELLRVITEDFKNFYKNSFSKEKFSEILLRKRENLEFHSLVCKIGANITKHGNIVIKSLIDSLFFEDVIGFLVYINGDFGVSTSGSVNGEKKNNLDFLLSIREKKKNIPFEQIKKFIHCIIEKSAEIILNIMVCSHDIITEFMRKLNITDLSSVLDLIKTSKILLEKYGMTLTLKEDYIKRLCDFVMNE